jgi:hypothetical protein
MKRIIAPSDDERVLLARRIYALRDACRASHTPGPGGASICICGASCGGSAACGALSDLRSLLMQVEAPQAWQSKLEIWQAYLA